MIFLSNSLSETLLGNAVEISEENYFLICGYWGSTEGIILKTIIVGLCVQVIEMKKIQANVQIGNILLRSRNYIKARPQVSINHPYHISTVLKPG